MAQKTKRSVKSDITASKDVVTPVASTPEMVTPAPEPAPVPETPDVMPTEPVKTPDSVVNDKFEHINSKINDMSALVRDVQTHLKTLQKELVKLVKSSTKKTKSRNNSGGKKTPSGFAKPTKLSDELCEFLSVESGTELARTEVTRRINTYIKEQNLQFVGDKRKINPDEKLGKILSIKEGDVLTFFNLQSYLKHNFVKTT
jgi:chromatin remodeling complex protein RSC6